MSRLYIYISGPMSIRRCIKRWDVVIRVAGTRHAAQCWKR
jgi:hypothetical protein